MNNMYGKILKESQLLPNEELDESVDNKEFELIEATDDDLVNLEKGSAFTFEGLMSDDKNLNDLVDFFKEKTNVKIPMKIYHATGEKVNNLYGLTGRNAYPNDLDIVLLPLDNWNELGDLPMIKTQIGARWFDDIVDNNRRRQEHMNESIDEINNIEANVEEFEEHKDGQIIREAQYQDTNYNTIVNAVVSALLPFCDRLEFKSMDFNYKLKNISGENKELIEEQYTKAMEELKDTLAKEGLTLSTSAMGEIIIKAR